MRASNLGRGRALSAVTIAAAMASLWARDARATTVLELSDNGSEQMGRGGAWVARASDPLATFYNPAGLAGQDTKLTLQGNINMLSTCFTRVKASNDSTLDNYQPGQSYPKVCSANGAFPDPQLAFTYKLDERVGLGFGVVAPSAAGSVSWPSTIGNNQPAPQRYLLISATTLLVTPTIGVGWEPVKGLRVGASFLWGIASFDFTNVSYGLNAADQSPATNDVKADLKVKNFFIPGFTLGTIWSPSESFDIAGWYKWLDPIVAKGDVTTVTGVGSQVKTGNSAGNNCGFPANATQYGGLCGPDKATVRVTVPMEAKVGFRYHMPRPGVEQAHRRDPLSQDVFDVEADLTWANNSSFQNVGIQFPGGANAIPVNGTPGYLPPDASIPHNFKDVYGVRVGGDYNLIADRLAIRLGGYFESSAETPQNLNLDFAGEQRVGMAIGGTYRIHIGSPDQKRAVELMAGLGHTFIASLTNPGPSGIPALTGTQCSTGSATGSAPCANGTTQFRTDWPVNVGTVTNSFNQINIGASYRF